MVCRVCSGNSDTYYKWGMDIMSLQAQGMRAWLMQRLTAVYIAIYALSLIVWMIINAPINYSTWSGAFSHPIVIISTVVCQRDRGGFTASFLVTK